MRSAAYLVSFSFAATVVAFSTVDARQTTMVSVRGSVVTELRAPVGGALVELLATGDSTRTSSQGEFTMRSAITDSVQLRIRAMGFAETIVWISADTDWTGTIVVQRPAQPLPEVRVQAEKTLEFDYAAKYADFFRRRNVGSGVFRSQEDFRRMGASDVVSALQGIPGVSVSFTSNPHGEPEVRFRMARCPGQPPNIGIYVNGRRVSLFAEHSENKGSELTGATRPRRPDEQKSTCDDCARLADVMSSVALSDIVFLEFYRGPGQIPSDLDRGDSCAALVLWTR